MQLILAPAVIGYLSHDTVPSSEAVAGVMLVLAGLVAAMGRGEGPDDPHGGSPGKGPNPPPPLKGFDRVTEQLSRRSLRPHRLEQIHDASQICKVEADGGLTVAWRYAVRRVYWNVASRPRPLGRRRARRRCGQVGRPDARTRVSRPDGRR